MVETNPSFQHISCINCATTADKHHVLVQTEVIHEGHLKGAPLTVVVCPKCGLVFLNPQPTREALGRFYEHEYHGGPVALPAKERLITRRMWQRDFFYSWLVNALLPEEVTSWNVLDIGSGYGVWLQWFDKSCRLVGVELSWQAANIASKLFGITVYQIDFMENRFQDEQFDLVTGLAVIEHFPDPLAALVEMNRVLKRGGYLYLQTPDLHGLVLRQGVEKYFKLVHTFYFSLATLSSLLQKAGFEVFAFRQRPALLETSSLWHPGNYWSGELDILARKRHERTLEDAQSHPYSGDDVSSVLSSLQAALKRDKLYIWLGASRSNRVPGAIVGRILRLGRWLTGTPRSIFEEQYIRLGLSVEGGSENVD